MIRKAKDGDLESILEFDSFGEDPKRQEAVRRSILNGWCHVFEFEGKVVAYGIIHNHFYERSFVELIVVSSSFRRQKVASSLLHHFENLSESDLLFISTNESNTPMRTLLAKLDYKQCGYIEGLDLGDPELIFSKPVAQSHSPE